MYLLKTISSKKSETMIDFVHIQNYLNKYQFFFVFHVEKLAGLLNIDEDSFQ